MSKRANTTTHEYLIKASLPEATDTYTVISHGAIIDKVREVLASKGLEIQRELYRCNEGAQVAQGIYHLNYGDDPDLGMMFAWSNSYDKSMRFKCSIGGYVHASLATVIGGNMATFGRKHTGTADQEVFDQIEEQINNAEEYFKQLIMDKEIMKNILAPEQLRAEFMGRAYYMNELVTGEQLGIVKTEFRKPSFEYSGITDSLWEMYNAIIFALQKSHPRTWMDQQRMIHYLICKDFNVGNPVLHIEESKPENIIADNPNQLNIIDAIKEAEQSVDVKEAVAPCIGHAIEQNNAEEVQEKADIIEEIGREAIEKYPVTMAEVEQNHQPIEVYEKPIDGSKYIAGIDPAVDNAQVVITPTEVADEDGWPCMKCGTMQPSTAIFYDGQLCGNCYEH